VRTILSFGINALAEEKEITWHFRINPQNEAAKKGLERLEKQMKGVDPDAPEEDEDNEADDIDADQDDAELL